MVVRDLREIFSSQKEAGELPEMKREHQRTQAGSGRQQLRLCEPEQRAGAVTLGSPAGLCRGAGPHSVGAGSGPWTQGCVWPWRQGGQRGGESCLGTRDMACLGEDKSVDWGM